MQVDCGLVSLGLRSHDLVRSQCCEKSRKGVRAAAWDGARRIDGSRRASSDATKVASAPEAPVVETTGAPTSKDAANTVGAFEARGADAAAGAADAVAATATDVAARPLTSDDVLDKAS